MIIDIVLVYTEGRGILEDLLSKISTKLIDRGHKVRIFQSYKPQYEEWISNFSYVDYYGLVGEIREENLDTLYKGYKAKLDEVGLPDIILATYTPSSIYISRKAVGFLKDKRPVILSLLYGDNIYLTGGELLNYADAHLAISKKISNYIVENIINKGNIYYIEDISNIEDILNGYNKNGEYYNSLRNAKIAIKDLINNNKISLAEELLKKYEELIKDDIEVYSIKSIIYILSDRVKEAYSYLKEAVSLYKNNIDILFNMAYVCERLNKDFEALKYYYDILLYSDDNNLNNEVDEKINNVYSKLENKNIKLKIDIVIDHIEGRGGTENVIEIISRELINRGYSVRVFQSYRSKYEEWQSKVNEFYCYGLKENRWEDTIYGLAEGYANKLKELGLPDIILATHIPETSYICKEALNILGENNITVLSWLHVDPNITSYPQLLSYVDNHISISNSISKSISKFISNEKSIYLIGNPIENNSYNVIKRIDNKLEFLYIGRLENGQKRVDTLLRALSLLQGDWHLTVIGDGVHGEQLKQLAIDLKINEKISWLGWQEKPWECVNNVTALVLPSQHEGFPLVLLESLQRGIPIITSRCAGSVDIVKDFKNGYSFKVGDYNQLHEILHNINIGNLILPTEEECKKTVEAYSIDNVINKFNTILVNEYMLKNK